jgi:hypothetical protein
MVTFEFFDREGGSIELVADDASERAARFRPEHKLKVTETTTGRFRLNGSGYEARIVRIRQLDGRQGSILVEYEAAPRWPRYLRWIPRVREFFGVKIRPRDLARERYKKPKLLAKLFRLMVPERVSRIHLYEAQERYVSLQRLLDFYEKTMPSDDAEQVRAYEICRDALNSASVLLTRRQNDLNYLWREMTQVHVTIMERLMSDQELPRILDFCREEARRLAVDQIAEVRELNQRCAEVMDETGANRARKIRLLRALIERFTTIRTGRIHEQLAHIRAYQKALLMLTPIAVLLIVMHTLVLDGQLPDPILPTFAEPATAGFLGFNYLISLVAYLIEYLEENVIAFVFFAGLAGGFLSVIIRLRARNILPGEDAYYAWYLLTKPWVGALGAAILYVLVYSGVVSSDLGGNLVTAIRNQEAGAPAFAFGFLAGFSERIAFPMLRGSSASGGEQEK